MLLESEDLMSQTEASRYLGCSATYVQKLIRKGALCVFKLGKLGTVRMLSREEVQKYKKNRDKIKAGSNRKYYF